MTTLTNRPNKALVVIDVQNGVVWDAFDRDRIVGNIATGAAAKALVEAGADLIQVWTGFIYEGPGMVKNICSYLSANK